MTDHDIFDNRLIFGDNLLALKALEQEFAGKVKCVFIDPPYNTGSAFEHYDDGVEHSLWLSLMRERLELLRRLLSDSGSLWITIDDTEAHYLKVVCDEVFGRENFLGNVLWEKADSPRMNASFFPFGMIICLSTQETGALLHGTGLPLTVRLSITTRLMKKGVSTTSNRSERWVAKAIRALLGRRCTTRWLHQTAVTCIRDGRMEPMARGDGGRRRLRKRSIESSGSMAGLGGRLTIGSTLRTTPVGQPKRSSPMKMSVAIELQKQRSNGFFPRRPPSPRQSQRRCCSESSQLRPMHWTSFSTPSQAPAPLARGSQDGPSLAEGGCQIEVSHGFTPLRRSAYTADAADTVHDHRVEPTDKTKIGRMLFGGFAKCLYRVQKFQSDTERRFAVILERDATRWFKPPRTSFRFSTVSGRLRSSTCPTSSRRRPLSY